MDYFSSSNKFDLSALSVEKEGLGEGGILIGAALSLMEKLLPQDMVSVCGGGVPFIMARQTVLKMLTV